MIIGPRGESDQNDSRHTRSSLPVVYCHHHFFIMIIILNLFPDAPASPSQPLGGGPSNKAGKTSPKTPKTKKLDQSRKFRAANSEALNPPADALVDLGANRTQIKFSLPHVGMRNSNNTCFINSTLQALFQTDSFLKDLFAFRISEPGPNASVVDREDYAVSLQILEELLCGPDDRRVKCGNGTARYDKVSGWDGGSRGGGGGERDEGGGVM